MEVLGIDVGGSGIKGAIVNTETGAFKGERFRLPTPEKAKPEAVGDVISELVAHFSYKGIVGVGFPSVVIGGVVHTAANISENWLKLNAAELIKKKTGCPAIMINDADAAGVAEMKFGAGREFTSHGVVLMLTLGTGIGSAIFTNGVLLPNTEFGHMKIRGKDAEHRSSDAVRQIKELSWKSWAKRLQEVISAYEALLWPDLIIVGGGVSKESKRFLPMIKTRAKIVPAELLNQAGIVGAAVFASQQTG